MSVISGLKATKIIGQRKAFYRQRIPEFRCARKETVDIDILVTSRNGDRKIMQSIRITSRPPSRKRNWNQLSQFRRTSTKVIPIEKTEAALRKILTNINQCLTDPANRCLTDINQYYISYSTYPVLVILNR